MKATTLTAGVLAAAMAIGASSALAADLDYGRVPADRYSSAYEDPRYRDLYGPEQRYSHPQRTYRVEPSYPAPTPPGYVYRNNDIYRPGPYEEPRRYSNVQPDDRYHRNGCLPRDEIKQRLVDEGWRDFHDLELRNNVAKIRARRPSGDLYDLKVDRCSGEIVNAQMIERGRIGPYAYDNGSRRYDRPYN